MSSKDNKSREIRCKLCGARNPFGAKRCRNYNCRADLMMYGEFVYPDDLSPEPPEPGPGTGSGPASEPGTGSGSASASEPNSDVGSGPASEPGTAAMSGNDTDPPIQENPDRKKKRGKWIAAACILLLLLAGVIALGVISSQSDDQGGRQEDTADEPETENGDQEDTDEEPEDTADEPENTGENQETADSRVMIGSNGHSLSAVFDNTAYDQDDIRTITFTDTLADVGEDAWDVSEAQDGSVMAWTAEADGGLYDLFIGADGCVIAPESCQKLFWGYNSLETIDFNGCFDTGDTTDMHGMFYSCDMLQTLDLSTFDTSNVTDMQWMFAHCDSLTEVNLSGWDTSNVTDMSHMFYCTTDELIEYLAENEFADLDTSSVTEYEDFINGVSVYDWTVLFE